MSRDDRGCVTGYLDMRTRMGWQKRWWCVLPTPNPRAAPRDPGRATSPNTLSPLIPTCSARSELRSDTCTFTRSHDKRDMSKSKPVNLNGISVRLLPESKSGKRFAIDHSDPIEFKASSREIAEVWVREIHEVQARHFQMAAVRRPHSPPAPGPATPAPA